MAIEFTPKNSLEQALHDDDRANVVRFVAEGEQLHHVTVAGWLAHSGFPEAVVQLVLKLALSPEQLTFIGNNLAWFLHYHGVGMRDSIDLALAPLPDQPNAAEKRLIDAVVRGDSARVVELVKQKRGTLRNFSPELLIMLPELSREATVGFLARGFAPAAVPKLFEFLLRETDSPAVLDSFSYRERLMYANLLIHILQGEAISPDDEWYPMGDAVENGESRGRRFHYCSYCFDPRHCCRPRRADGECEYEKPEHDTRKA